jgi:hypothetical protein
MKLNHSQIPLGALDCVILDNSLLVSAPLAQTLKSLNNATMASAIVRNVKEITVGFSLIPHGV